MAIAHRPTGKELVVESGAASWSTVSRSRHGATKGFDRDRNRSAVAIMLLTAVKIDLCGPPERTTVRNWLCFLFHRLAVTSWTRKGFDRGQN